MPSTHDATADATVDQLSARVEELTDLLDAIRSGAVDAIVAGPPGEERVYSLTNADKPYRRLVERMDQGALICAESGVILYANPAAASLVGRPSNELIGALASSLFDPGTPLAVGRLLDRPPSEAPTRVTLKGSTPAVVCDVAVSAVDVGATPLLCLVLTDVSSHVAVEHALASELVHSGVQLEQANAMLDRSNTELRTLLEVNESLVHAYDEEDLVRRICADISEHAGYPLVWVSESPPDGTGPVRELGAADGSGYLATAIPVTAEGRSGAGPTGRALQTGRIHIVEDTLTDPDFAAWRGAARHSGIRSVCSLPIQAPGLPARALTVGAAAPGAFGLEALSQLSRLVDDLGYGMARLHDGSLLAESRMATILSLSRASELRDAYTAGHQRRVAELAEAIARHIGLSEFDVQGVKTAALVHDIGKLAVPAEILAQPRALLPVEFELIKLHPGAGADLVADVPFEWPVADMIRQHHERLDGSGYPSGLCGEEILVGARILAVADVVEAMSSRRPYRAALGLDVALSEIERKAGGALDKDVVGACVFLCRRSSLRFNPEPDRPFGRFPGPRPRSSRLRPRPSGPPSASTGTAGGTGSLERSHATA